MIEAGNYPKLKKELRNVNINSIRYKDMTPLAFACRNSVQPQIIKLLINNSSELDSRNGESQLTPLHLACMFSMNPVVVEMLLKAGASPTLVSFGEYPNWTPLHFACFGRSKPQIIKVLLKNGAKKDINTKEGANHMTPLHFACKYGRIEVVSELLRAGADVEAETKETPLAFTSSPEIKKALLSHNFVQEEYLELYECQELCDIEISFEEQEPIYVHSLILKARLGKSIDIDEIVKILQSFDKTVVDMFLVWIYSGSIIDKLGEFQVIELANRLGLITRKFHYKSGRKGILRDLKQLYKERSSTDFIIKVPGNKLIRAHSVILMARSKLFKNLILKGIYEYMDTTAMSRAALKCIVRYLYTDKLKKMNFPIAREFADIDIVSDFRLGRHSSINPLLLDWNRQFEKGDAIERIMSPDLSKMISQLGFNDEEEEF